MNLINHSWGNASLQASNESLSQSNRELDQFAYVASHDLKAPLRAIASLAEWIEEDLGGSVSTETRLHLGLLRRRVDRMQGLLNSLLEYSRAGRKQTPITIVNVEHLLTEVIQALAPPETFTINIISPMPTISTRLQPLQQVFSHLIDNAIRHHPTESGIIEISVIDQGDQHEFSISDNGNGIDIQFQERIYTIFQTLEARDRQENIGAGLAIIKKIVMAEGGAVRLKSAAGNGASFRFTWLKQPIIKDSLISLPEP
jgi:light-regulated signal transduction histidine kinase (bacteriophytochrome)